MADGITCIAVEGFKSIAKRQEIEIRPLTILAGANSSGKSSIMQPLLMLKQTLEATYDPGPLLISDAHLNFASTDQFLSKTAVADSPRKLTIEIGIEGAGFHIVLQKSETGMELVEQQTVRNGTGFILRPNMRAEEIAAGLGVTDLLDLRNLRVIRNRFFLGVGSLDMPNASVAEWVTPVVRNILHVPGLRGNRSRVYNTAAVEESFQGPFDSYVASVISLWQRQKSLRYGELISDLQHLDLAQNLLAKKLNDKDIQLLVNRAEDSPYDLIDIADVGFGVSQTLPVLVALRAAEQGRLVYLEEPEIHLHPRAQTKLAGILADAARRGVRVVAETHSSLLLRAIQTLVAKGNLDPELVRLHWFTRDPEGITQVSSTKLDANGAFGDWPEDFGDVALRSEQEYLDAVEDRLTH